jgi:uncharacterized membrane protein HdeD (DUF308 family)
VSSSYATKPVATDDTKHLRTLYYARFGFAIAWAVLMMAIGKTINPATVVLLLLYPLFDVAAAVIDFRTSGSTRPKSPLYINMILSLLTTVALAVAAASGIPSVLRVWGAWAITAGIVQLIVAILRYRLGGQWAMILSGGISVLAGGSFIVMAGGPKASLTSVAGYAILGGVFFLISAVRLHRLASKAN